jgi:hypothetical protein
MGAYIVRVGDDYVRLVHEAQGLVLLTDNKDDAGWYSEAGAHRVMAMVEELYPGRKAEVTH